ncbi:probable pectinesterase 53 [Vigna unguiculata]|uniref:Pectinesterase n=1 Tax=Vigna unguiculata TaxID=3917 RepID=A0A4D6N019_VIGUN|nr:probable pectinesterase 53 [Vigna unguiculata]QCE07123.1 pectinesterase [Vigna unguiculata]
MVSRGLTYNILSGLEISVTLVSICSAMVSKTHSQLIFLFLFLLSSLNIASSSYTHNVANFDKWISFNVKKHEERKNDPGPDLKLRQAESNKVTITVSQDGSGHFKTISEALNSIPPRNTRRVIVSISPGVYREKVMIPRTMAFVTLSGNAGNPLTITGNDTASASGRNGSPLGTFQSATVAVDGSYFVAINIKFENSAPHEIGRRGEQGVALRISGTKAAFYNCSFSGAQDTLYDHKGLHFFNNCYIQGSVDFIFGSARSLYQNCYLNSTTKKVASITAQKRTNSSLEGGFSFKNCTVTGSGHVYLGRAWGDYSRVVFSYTYMDNLVLPKGWSDWGHQNRDSRVYYGEYMCSGPGANFAGRVPWARVLNDEEAKPFIGTQFIEGDTWLIDTW